MLSTHFFCCHRNRFVVLIIENLTFLKFKACVEYTCIKAECLEGEKQATVNPPKKSDSMMNSSAYPFILTICCLFQVHLATAAQCLNNSTYSYKEPTKTCSWIRWKEERRQILCLIDDVRTNCPQSCGLCCEDDISYTFVSSSLQERTCSWIDSANKTLYCSRTRDSQTIRNACPKTCGICKEEVKLEETNNNEETNTNEETNNNEETNADEETNTNEKTTEPLIRPEEPTSYGKETGIILGTLFSSVAVIGLITLCKKLRKKDKLLISASRDVKENHTGSSSEDESFMDESSKDEATKNDVEKGTILDDIKEMCLDGVSPDGVSVYWIKHQFFEHLKEHGLDANSTLQEVERPYNNEEKGLLYTVGEHHICPRDGGVGAAIVDSLVGEDNVGPANIMLSFNSENSVGDIVDTVWDYCFYNNLNPKRTYIWTSFLCNNHHRPSKSEYDGSHVRESYLSLCQRIYSIGSVLSIVSPLIEPLYFKSVLGMFELYTADALGCNLIIAMPPGEKRKMIMESLQNENNLLDLYESVDQAQIEDAKSYKAGEREYVLDIIQRGPGIEEVNNSLKTVLRRWAKSEIMKALKYHEGRSKIPAKDEDLAFLCSQVGYVLSRVNESDDALKLYKKALGIYTKVRGEEHTDVASLYMNTGMVLQATGDLQGAVKEYRKVLDIDHILYGEEHIETSNTYNTIGMAMEADGNLHGAVDNYQKSLEIRESIFGSENPYTAQSYNHIGLVFNAMEKYDEALSALTKARDIYIKVKGYNHSYTAQSSTNIGYVYHSMGDNEAALKAFKSALNVVEQVKGEMNNQKATATAYNNIGMVLDSFEDYESAVFHYRIALDITRQEFGENYVDTGISYNNVGGALLSKGDYNEALKVFEKADKILSKTLGRDHQHTLVVRSNIQRCEKKRKASSSS